MAPPNIAEHQHEADDRLIVENTNTWGWRVMATTLRQHGGECTEMPQPSAALRPVDHRREGGRGQRSQSSLALALRRAAWPCSLLASGSHVRLMPRPSSALRPVSERNTSSSVGSRTVSDSGARPAAERGTTSRTHRRWRRSAQRRATSRRCRTCRLHSSSSARRGLVVGEAHLDDRGTELRLSSAAVPLANTRPYR